MVSSQFYDPTTAEYLNPETKRRVAIVTGGNSGIGWYTVLHLYLHGYIVYVAGRNEKKVLKALEEIKVEAEKRIEKYSDIEKQSRHVGALEYIYLDCCDLKLVEKCALSFMSKETKLHVMINNAGIMAVPHELTKDNYEIQYQVNFVAPFLFTLKLLPALKAAEADTLPRLINLSSVGHAASFIFYDPTDTIDKFPLAYYSWIRYAAAKCAAIQATKKFAEQYPEILAFSIHPGVIPQTELANWWMNMPVLGWAFKAAGKIVERTIGVSVEEGSLATLRAAMDTSLGKKDSGSYLFTGGELSVPSAVAQNQEYIDTTWNKNLEMLRERNFEINL